MECIISGGTFSLKWSTQLYSGELGCRSVLVWSLHPIVTYLSKKLHGHSSDHTPVNGINLLAQLCQGIQKSFPAQMTKEKASSQHTCTKWPSPNRQPGNSSCASEVNSFTNKWKNLNIPSAKETGNPLHCFALNVTINYNYNRNKGSGDCRGAKYTNWINEGMHSSCNKKKWSPTLLNLGHQVIKLSQTIRLLGHQLAD